MSTPSINQSLKAIEALIARQKLTVKDVAASRRYPDGAQRLRRYGLDRTIPSLPSSLNAQVVRTGDWGS